MLGINIVGLCSRWSASHTLSIHPFFFIIYQYYLRVLMHLDNRISQTLTYEDVTLNTSCAYSSYFIATTLFGCPASVWISLPLLRSQIFTVLSNKDN